jgi:hypothetical protein
VVWSEPNIPFKLKLETWEFMPGIKNLNLKFVCIFFGKNLKIKKEIIFYLTTF